MRIPDPRLLALFLLLASWTAPRAAGQTDSLTARTSDTSTQVPRLVVTTSTAVGGLATIRVEQSRLSLSASAILQLGGFTPAAPAGGDLRYGAGTVLYYDGGAWQTVAASGSATAGFVLVGPAAVQTDASASATVFVNDTGGGNLLHLRSGGTDRLVVSNAGVVSSGTWQATAVGPTYGGTGQSAVAAGDLLYGSAVNTWSRLAGPGAAGQYPRASAANTFSWSTIQAGDLPSGSGYYLARNAADSSSAAVAGDLYAFTNSSAAGVVSVLRCLQTASAVANGTWTSGYFSAAAGDNTSDGFVSYCQALRVDATGASQIVGGTTFNYGVRATASGSTATGTTTNYAVDAQASGADATTNYGVRGSASGVTTGTNYGVWGSAVNGGTNWAGYFSGNGRFTGTLTVDSTADPGLTLGSALTAYFQIGDAAAKIYRNGNNRILVRAENTDNVAQFASYGLYLPLDPGISFYSGGDVSIGYAGTGDDDYAYFDQQAEYLRWVEGSTRFEFSDDVYSALTVTGSRFTDADNTLYYIDPSGPGGTSGELAESLYIGLASGADNDYIWYDLGSESFGWNNGGYFFVSDDILPNGPDSWDLGSAAQYWNEVYSNNFVNVSRREKKKDIEELDRSELARYADVIRRAPVARFRFKSEFATAEEAERNRVEIPMENGRTKSVPGNVRTNSRLGTFVDGMPPEVVTEDGSGVDLASYCGLLLAGVKDLQNQVTDLQGEIARLQGRLGELEGR